MHYTTKYQSPVGEILIAADDIGLTGVWFAGGRYYALELDKQHEEKQVPVFALAKRWLDEYFLGKEPDFMPPIHMIGTAFQLEVWKILCTIPYGKTTSYGEIAKQIAQKRGLHRMSAQAVGTAVGKNPLSLIVPCHRVVGTNGSLAGYAGGIDKKIVFLKLEGAYKDEFFLPKHL